MKKLFLCAAVLSVALSCQKNPVEPVTIAGNHDDVVMSDDVTVLGKQLENPYSVKNMRRAMSNLSPATRAGIDTSDIVTTHCYVRFHPKTEDELDMLLQDTSIVIYDIPLDYEVETYGTYYHDPSIPDSLPTYQYASVPVGQMDAIEDVGVEYDVLSELFIPDEEKTEAESDPETRSVQEYFGSDLISALVDEALRITGNEEEECSETKARSSWTPSGKVKVYDDLMSGMIPVVGAKVRAQTLVHDAHWLHGHFRCIHVRRHFQTSGELQYYLGTRILGYKERMIWAGLLQWSQAERRMECGDNKWQVLALRYHS